MKILITTGIFPPDVGGPAGYVKRIIPEFLKLGHSVRVLTYSDDFNGETTKNGYRLFNIKRASKFSNYFRYFLKVLKYAKDADVIYLQDSVSAGLPTTLANLILKKRLVLKIVGDYAWEMGGNKIKPTLDEFYPFDENIYSSKIILLQKIQAWVAKKANKIITPSEYLKKIVSDGWEIKSEKIHVIYNSTVIPAEAGIHKDKNLIFSVGRLVPWKGFDTLIELMFELPQELKLEITGGGPEEENLKALIKAKNLEDRVKLVGKLPHDELIKKLKTVGLFVLNTRYEGLSHVLIEALVCGAPIITTNVGGNPEVIEDYKNGYLVDYDDKIALKSTILKLWNDKNLQEQFRQNGYKSLEKFDFNKMIKKTLKILKEDLNVLMVSTDKTILDSQSVSAGRMRDYGTICDELHILVCKTGKSKVEISKNVWAYSMFGVNKILKSTKYNVITTQDPFKTGIIGYLFSKILNTKLNIQLHGDFYGSNYWKGFLREIGIFIIKRADSIRVVSPKIKESLEKLNIEKKITVAPIYTDPEKIKNTPTMFSLKERHPENSQIYLTVGRLEKEKNYPFLFRVFKRVLEKFPKALLVIVGDGSMRKELEEKVKEIGIGNNVKFEGFQKDLISYYKTADVYVSASKTDGWGMTIIESALSGCPMVLSKNIAASDFASRLDVHIIDDYNEDVWSLCLIETFLNNRGRELDVEARASVNALSYMHYHKQGYLDLIKQSWDKT